MKHKKHMKHHQAYHSCQYDPTPDLNDGYPSASRSVWEEWSCPKPRDICGRKSVDHVVISSMSGKIWKKTVLPCIFLIKLTFLAWNMAELVEVLQRCAVCFLAMNSWWTETHRCEDAKIHRLIWNEHMYINTEEHHQASNNTQTGFAHFPQHIFTQPWHLKHISD